MWYKVNELKEKGLHCVQIAHELGLHRHTVEKYVKMSLEEFQTSEAYERNFKYKLDIFEEEVKNKLIRAPYLSSRQVHDHLREHHPSFPTVSEKTVFNFVMRIRDKYQIPCKYPAFCIDIYRRALGGFPSRSRFVIGPWRDYQLYRCA